MKSKGKPAGKKSDEHKISNLYDLQAITQLLDDVIADNLRQRDLSVDLRFNNYKNIMYFVSCALAVLAWYVPMPFPDKIPIVVACVLTYYVIQGVYWYMQRYYECGYHIFTPEYAFRTGFDDLAEPLFSITMIDRREIALPKRRAVIRRSIEEYFNASGFLNEKVFTQDIDDLFSQFSKKSH